MLFEQRPACGQFVEVRGGRRRVPVRAEGVGAQVVRDDQEDLAAGAGAGAAARRRCAGLR
ncbi:hypothetical protein GCM10010389_33650 [Streptomyces echinoruber]|uniref:Uncharacterized protein n=1 Tax=Streptomyces echinoruber TaxID=68898 RepID=A0A918VEW9_9ACTN|nr:hypothetical protein [Streptomyces echinoruber]GGZ92294.1 hypothetical protein GCM10010389_33650 [Streptomyces echinoruber]